MALELRLTELVIPHTRDLLKVNESLSRLLLMLLMEISANSYFIQTFINVVQNEVTAGTKMLKEQNP